MASGHMASGRVQFVGGYFFVRIFLLMSSAVAILYFLDYLNFLNRLNLESLKETIQEKYERILMYFGRDIDTIQKIYQRHRNDPPIAWDLPPIAGKIAWARQMYRRIQEPMEMFQKYPTILQNPEAKKVIKNYNKLAKVLLEFELLYHQAWMKQVKSNINFKSMI